MPRAGYVRQRTDNRLRCAQRKAGIELDIPENAAQDDFHTAP